MSNLERRLAKLEAQRGTQVYAVRFADCDEIALCGGGATQNERMTLAEWHRRFPNGVLIHVVYKHLWENV